MTLIRRAKSNSKAFAKLYDAHIKGVYQYVAWRIQNRQEIEDLTAEIWETVLKNIHQLQSDNEVVFKAWLYTIARNTLNHFYRDKEKTATVPLEEMHNNIKTENKTPHEDAELKENTELLRRLIEKLPQQQRETLTLHFLSDLKNKEIAALQNLSEKTVASNLSRALATLRSNFKKLQ
ncbi:MAG: RNA polymerase sigma factor [Patescibacteria group bacterium]